MLTDPIEIECVKNAKEPGIRDPLRPRTHFLSIITHFFKDYNFDQKNILDLGPGHYDLGEIIKIKGGETTSIELDPAVIKLGQLKKMKVIEGNLTDPKVFANLTHSFDGLFNRGSFNARNFKNNIEHKKYLESMISAVKPSGVFWLAPCNDPIVDSTSGQDIYFKDCVEFQISFFKKNGFEIIECPPAFIKEFGIWSSKPNLIYTKNLNYDLNKVNRKLWIKNNILDFPRKIFSRLTNR